jgi:hypothetical protein
MLPRSGRNQIPARSCWTEEGFRRKAKRSKPIFGSSIHAKLNKQKVSHGALAEDSLKVFLYYLISLLSEQSGEAEVTMT